MVKFERKDIVRLSEPKFEELKVNLWFKDNAFEITKVEEGGMALFIFSPVLYYIEIMITRI